MRATCQLLGLIACTAVVSAALAGCGPALPGYQTEVGPSGTTWRVLSVERDESRRGVETLKWRYETDKDFEDVEALRMEARFFLQDQSAKLASDDAGVVIVAPNTPRKTNWAAVRDEHRFRFARRDDGSWDLVSDKRVSDVTFGEKREHPYSVTQSKKAEQKRRQARESSS